MKKIKLKRKPCPRCSQKPFKWGCKICGGRGYFEEWPRDVLKKIAEDAKNGRA